MTTCRQGILGIVAALALVLSAGSARAVMEVVDIVPSATLLVPYFEVDPNPDKPSVTTELTVINTETSMFCLAHATLYTDLGLPTVNFNIQIPPGGMVEVDLHDIFATGQLPFPAFGSDCESLSATMPASTADLANAHTGAQSNGLLGGQCGAVPRGDGMARGFLTIDSVDDCTTQTPRDTTYFTNDATETNVLLGSYSIRRSNPQSATRAPMVHIEADSGSLGLESFYYRFPSTPSPADGREPLPQIWSVPFHTDMSEVVCWADFLAEAPFPCDPPLIFGLPLIAVTYSHLGEPFTPEEVIPPCAGTSTRTLIGSAGFPADAKTGTVVIDITAPVFATTSGGFEPRRQVAVSATQRIHPNGLAIHVPGTVVDDDLIPPLLLEAPK